MGMFGARLGTAGMTALAAVSLFLTASPAFAENGIAQLKTVVEIEARDQILARYRYEDVPFKPYLSEFYTPDGVNVLRDAPHDHLHHHALMFALAVDGVDFWAENENCGHQRHIALEAIAGKVFDDADYARFTERLEWRHPKDQRVLLVEHRTIETVTAEDIDASLLTWQSRLELPPGKASAELTGAHYFGLGLRFLECMDGVGEFMDADSQPGSVVRGEERNVPAAWCAYTADAGAGPVTVAMFGHPDNPRHPTTWFTMPVPFAYLSATLNLHKEPMTLASGQSLILRYGVALWDGRVDRETIQQLYERWVARPAPAETFDLVKQLPRQ